MRFVFMGTENFGLPALEKLIEKGHSLAAIVSTPARYKGRGRKLIDSPVSLFSNKKGFSPLFTPQNLKNSNFISKLKAVNADFFLVAAFRILPEEVFTIPSFGTLNIHASLLPAYRGAAPVQRSIEAGEESTGVTIFHIDKGIDTGNIILQKHTDIGSQETAPQLYRRLSLLGAEAVEEAVDLLQRGNGAYFAQDDSRATKAPKLSKQEGRINFDDTARQIYNRIRAFKPFPGTYTFLKGRRLEIEWAIPVEYSSNYSPGHICKIDREWFDVQCRDSVLRVLEVKPEGKKNMPAPAFMRGTGINTGMRLG